MPLYPCRRLNKPCRVLVLILKHLPVDKRLVTYQRKLWSLSKTSTLASCGLKAHTLLLTLDSSKKILPRNRLHSSLDNRCNSFSVELMNLVANLHRLRKQISNSKATNKECHQSKSSSMPLLPRNPCRLTSSRRKKTSSWRQWHRKPSCMRQWQCKEHPLTLLPRGQKPLMISRSTGQRHHRMHKSCKINMNKSWIIPNNRTHRTWRHSKPLLHNKSR